MSIQKPYFTCHLSGKRSHTSRMNKRSLRKVMSAQLYMYIYLYPWIVKQWSIVCQWSRVFIHKTMPKKNDHRQKQMNTHSVQNFLKCEYGYVTKLKKKNTKIWRCTSIEWVDWCLGCVSLPAKEDLGLRGGPKEAPSFGVCSQGA